MTFKIYSTNAETFEKGDLDPFGFDALSEQISPRYIPFSGTVRKPAYYLFVSYINKILDEKLITYKTFKEKNEIKIRLEKLLVYCWKSENNNLRGQNVIGNSAPKDEIDPFSSNDWRKQNCFKIYTEKNFFPLLFNFYWNRIGEYQVNDLNEFITQKKLLPVEQKDYLKNLRKSLSRRKYSLFSSHLMYEPLTYKGRKELAKKMYNHNPEYYQVVESFFNVSKFNQERFWKLTLENKRLPFINLNNWFSAFVKAVDADIENLRNRRSLWQNADNYFSILSNDKAVSSYIKSIGRRPNKDNWFEQKDGVYILSEKLKQNVTQWESYKRRQGEDYGSRFFSTFRHTALANLIRELL